MTQAEAFQKKISPAEVRNIVNEVENLIAQRLAKQLKDVAAINNQTKPKQIQADEQVAQPPVEESVPSDQTTPQEGAPESIATPITPTSATMPEAHSEPPHEGLDKSEKVGNAEGSEQAVENFKSQLEAFTVLEKKLRQINEQQMAKGNPSSVELSTFQLELFQATYAVMELGENPSPEQIAALTTEFEVLKELADRAEETLGVSGAVPQAVEKTVDDKSAAPAAETVSLKPDDQVKQAANSKIAKFYESIDKLRQNHMLLNGLVTSAARMFTSVMGFKLITELVGLGGRAVAEKKKGEKNYIRKALENSSTDLGKYLYGGINIFGKEIGPADTKSRRAKLQQTIGEIFELKWDEGDTTEAGRWAAREKMSAKMKEVQELIKGATYLSDVERQAYRDKLARTYNAYRKKQQDSSEALREQVRGETETYIHNKALGYAVKRDALNFGLMASGAGFLSLAGYVGFSAAQRIAQGTREYMHKLREAPGTPERAAAKKTGAPFNLWKFGGYIAKDLTWNVASETVNSLLLRGKRAKLTWVENTDDKGEKVGKYEYRRRSAVKIHDRQTGKFKLHIDKTALKKNAPEFIAALGTVFSAVGTAALAKAFASDKIGENIGHLIEQIPKQYEQRGLWGMFEENFVNRASSIIQNYGYAITHPVEYVSKMWDSLTSFGAKKTSQSDSSNLEIEREFIRKEHPEVIKGTARNPVELPSEIKQQVQQEIQQGKLNPSVVESFLHSRAINQDKSFTLEDIHKFSELTKVEAGGSYWSTFMKQFHADPKAFGYEGDLTNQAAIDAYGKRLVVDYAFREGLVIKNADGSLTDMRIKNPNAHVVWKFTSDKGLQRVEFEPDKASDKLETYWHTDEPKPAPAAESLEPKQSSAEAAIVPPHVAVQPAGEIESAATTGTKIEVPSNYVEVNLASQFRGAKSLDHNLHVFAGDLSGNDGAGDGLIDHLQFRDDKGQLVMEIELGKESQKGLAELMPAIYEKTQALDRNISAVAELLPRSSKSLTVPEQIEIARLAVRDEFLLQDQDLSGDYGERFAKLDELIAGRRDFLADKDFVSYLRKEYMDLERDDMENLFVQGRTLKQAGFKQVDYNLVADYVSKERPIEFVSKNGRVVFQHYESNGEPNISPLTGKQIEVPAQGEKSFDRVTIDRYENAADVISLAHTKIYNSLHELASEEIVRRVLDMPCSEVTDTQLAEMLPPGLRHKANDLYGYLVREIGNGDETQLDKQGTKTVGEVLSERAAARANLLTPKEEVAPASAVESVKGQSAEAVVNEVKAEVAQAQQAGAGGVAGIREQAAAVFAEQDTAIDVYAKLHDANIPVEKKLELLKTLKLTDGGRPYMFKGNTEGIGLKDGKYYYYHNGQITPLVDMLKSNLAAMQAEAERLKSEK